MSRQPNLAEARTATAGYNAIALSLNSRLMNRIMKGDLCLQWPIMPERFYEMAENPTVSLG